ncbi:MAG: hypothetical protein HY553_14005 [Elusimicrobia bacterium]|nr:hypothetical protein [Elusimicrobiota bacterium]
MLPELRRAEPERDRRRWILWLLGAAAPLALALWLFRAREAQPIDVEAGTVGPASLGKPSLPSASARPESSPLPIGGSALLLSGDDDAQAFKRVMDFFESAGKTAVGRDFATEALKDPELRAAWEAFKAEAEHPDGGENAGRAQAAVKRLADAAAKSDRFQRLMMRFSGAPGFQSLTAEASRIPVAAAVLGGGPPSATGPVRQSSPVRSVLASSMPSLRTRPAAGAPPSFGPSGAARQSAASGGAIGPSARPPRPEGGRTLTPPSDVKAGPDAHHVKGLGLILGAGNSQDAGDIQNSLWAKMPRSDRDAIETVLLAGQAGDLWSACALAGRHDACRAAYEACRLDPASDVAGFGAPPTPDGNACTFDVCEANGCRYPSVPAGQDPYNGCGGHFCNGQGGCDGYCGSSDPASPDHCWSGVNDTGRMPTSDCKEGYVCDCWRPGAGMGSRKCVAR